MGRGSKKRRSEFKKPKPVFYLFVEGQNTEKRYFSALKAARGLSNVQIKFHNKTADPVGLRAKIPGVQEQVGKTTDPKKDKTYFWLVFDRDEHKNFDEVVKTPKLPKKRYKYPVDVAFSNPCIEVWLLWHFQESIPSHDRHMIQKKCNELLSIDTKTCTELDFQSILFDKEERLDNAIKNAKKNYNPDKLPSQQSPCSTIFLLIEAILSENSP